MNIVLVCLQDNLRLDIRTHVALTEWIVCGHIACMTGAFGYGNWKVLTHVVKATGARIGKCLTQEAVLPDSDVAEIAPTGFNVFGKCCKFKTPDKPDLLINNGCVFC